MLVPFNINTATSDKATHWTHSSYFNQEQLQKVESAKQRAAGHRTNLGLIGIALGLGLGSNPKVSNLFKNKVPLAGVAAIFGVGFYAIGHIAFVSGAGKDEYDSFLRRSKIPLWKDKKYVINVDRAFFHLDQTKNNQPDLLYHGLDAEKAAKIFPDAYYVGPQYAEHKKQTHAAHHGAHH